MNTNSSTNFSTNAYGPNSSNNASTNFGTNAYGTNASTNDSTNAYGTDAGTNASSNMTVPMNGSRRLTFSTTYAGGPISPSVLVSYAISLERNSLLDDVASTESYRIAAALRNSLPDETARLFRSLVQAEGLPYAVNGAYIMTVSV